MRRKHPPPSRGERRLSPAAHPTPRALEPNSHPQIYRSKRTGNSSGWGVGRVKRGGAEANVSRGVSRGDKGVGVHRPGCVTLSKSQPSSVSYYKTK